MDFKRYRGYLILVLCLVLLDQLVKYFFISFFQNSQIFTNQLRVTAIFDIVYVWNHGISFGLFQGVQNINIVFFLVNFIIIVYFVLMLFKAYTGSVLVLSLSFIVGGGISNLIDRVFYGAVFDFISLHYKGFYFPAFNIADACITVGGLIWFYTYVKHSEK
ncbi:signal peptidase II [Rickettsia endosymbiont of Cardiosporidium cionae]|uniref:signal peptidase II n=1 Tax=Rickettsia endosymbiont of Cardiosporidium cionae TaxID=2777155 RepID=UPI001895858A|nr:signal peptidase II [Rickettsia endosymbiont of Cardiosporidium cionae]KAF8818441.1 lipoprotein signal peptidase [Rickettsia endosymbiont of Cardiosporidium cionae]